MDDENVVVVVLVKDGKFVCHTAVFDTVTMAAEYKSKIFKGKDRLPNIDCIITSAILYKDPTMYKNSPPSTDTCEGL